MKLKFTTPEDVKDFVAVCDRCPLKLSLSDGFYNVNAKSILGVFSLEFGGTLELTAMISPGVDQEDYNEAMKELRQGLKRFYED